MLCSKSNIRRSVGELRIKVRQWVNNVVRCTSKSFLAKTGGGSPYKLDTPERRIYEALKGTAKVDGIAGACETGSINKKTMSKKVNLQQKSGK